MNRDFFHPIVIKELRQGLKSRFFLFSLCMLQLAMVISMFTYLVSASGTHGNTKAADLLFWGMLNLLFFQVLPIRGFQALYDEIKGNTLELLLVTRMTARNITFGKWLGLIMQTGLILSAILPYLVLRYFLGSINITHDLYKLAGILLFSMVLAAIGVGLSFLKSTWVRTCFILIGVFGNWLIGIWIYSALRIGGLIIAPSSSPSFPSATALGWTCFLSAFTIWFFLEFGSSKIAPKEPYYAR